MRAAMSGLRAPPLPRVLTVGAGRLAALTLPRGVDDVVMPAVYGAEAAEVETERGERRGGWLPSAVSGGVRPSNESAGEDGERGEVGDEGDGRGEGKIE